MATNEAKIRGMTLLIESLHKPDPRLRGCAYNQDCFNDMIQFRDETIDFLQTRLKEIQENG